MTVIVQPAFYFFGPSLDAAVISLNFAWFILAWSLSGITRELVASTSGDKAGFFAFVLFALYPLTTMLTHSYLVEFLLIAFVCAAMYSLLLLHKTKEVKWSVLAGICIGLGLLTKVTFPAFLLPAFGILIFRNIRNTSIRIAVDLFYPAILLPIVIAGPYYLYNFKQMFQLTAMLSSHSLSKLYGFGGAFDARAIFEFLIGAFANPVFLVSVFCFVATLFYRRNQSAYKSIDRPGNYENKTILIVMAIWFIIPFLLTMFGEIKETRYAYPGMVPIFVFTGMAVARNSMRKSGLFFMVLIYMLALPGYLYSNNMISAKSIEAFASAMKMDGGLVAGVPADERNWRVDNLVQEISDVLGARQENKNVIFLGGNRYYHLRLLDYFGLIGGAHVQYIVLPYYLNPSMTLDEALKFIAEADSSGVMYKSGENWPPFSSRLDSAIVSRLKGDPKYIIKELNTEQPDGSRFTLFVKRPPSYVSVQSISDLIGGWKVADGLASIDASDGGSLTITTETGLKGFAMIQAGAINVPDWKISGRVTSDLKSIHWSNGSIWIKSSSEKP